MSLTGSLSIASNEINNINSQLALVSHNIANASTPDYSVEEISQTSLTAGGLGLGAVDGNATRVINQQVQADLFGQNATVAGLQTQQTALQQIDAVQGAVGSGGDLSSLLGKVQDAFTNLEGSPSDPTLQQEVVSAAQTLTTHVNSVAEAVTNQRQNAQNAVVAGVASVNTALASIGSLSDQIVQAKLAGQSTADLENQRDAAEDGLSQLITVKFQETPTGDVQVSSPTGLNLPIHFNTPPLTTAAATVGAGSSEADGTIPSIQFDGRDVTGQLAGGSLGANITLRDQTLPGLQANLDEFSQTLSTRFAAQGLTLFTGADGTVPAGGGTPVQTGYIGYANTIQVNPAVIATPSLVRDGTDTIAGSATGASAFTPNPAGGPAGFTGLIQRVLNYSFGTNVQAGVTQPAANVSGLGVDGNLTSGYTAPGDLGDLATAVVGGEAQISAAATTQLGSEQSVQSTFQSQLAAGGAVSVDTELSKLIVLQNAYGANAHVLTVVQSMFTTLLQAVT